MLQRVEPQVFDNHNIPDQPITAIVATPVSAFQQHQHHCFGDSITQKKSPLSSNPSIFLRVFSTCNLDPQDLAKLETSGDYVHYENGVNFKNIYTFGSNSSRQLGHGPTEEEWLPQSIWLRTFEHS